MMPLLLILNGLVLLYLLLVVFGFWLRHETTFRETADVAIVMGSMPFKALPRIQKAADLYHRGFVRKLILTGKPLVDGQTEAQWLRRQALALGVADDDLLLEEGATNSKENMQFCRPIIEAHNFRSVIIIQQEFSQVRGYLTAKKQFAGLNVRLINQPATAKPYWNKWTWMFHRLGWRYSWATVSRLVRYRLQGDL
ncbi:MAG: YdcF family protein [Chloroflexota bacterium]